MIFVFFSGCSAAKNVVLWLGAAKMVEVLSLFQIRVGSFTAGTSFIAVTEVSRSARRSARRCL
jgi:hypothetical protein